MISLGQPNGAPLDQLLPLLGKDETLNRIYSAVKHQVNYRPVAKKHWKIKRVITEIKNQKLDREVL